MYCTLTPAYGRDYRSRSAVLTDFDDDKDFTLNDMSSRWDGKSANRSQLIKAGYKQVSFRYGKLRKQFPHMIEG